LEDTVRETHKTDCRVVHMQLAAVYAESGETASQAARALLVELSLAVCEELDGLPTASLEQLLPFGLDFTALAAATLRQRAKAPTASDAASAAERAAGGAGERRCSNVPTRPHLPYPPPEVFMMQAPISAPLILTNQVYRPPSSGNSSGAGGFDGPSICAIGAASGSGVQLCWRRFYWRGLGAALQLCNYITVAEAMGGLDALLASITSAIGHSQGVTAAVIVGAAEGKNSFGALAR
jgi:hypothetical protein